MSLTEMLFHPGLLPFEIAAGVVLGLLLIEALALQLGGSLLGAEADIEPVGEIDADADADAEQDGSSGGVLGWLGLGDVPAMIWLTGVLTAFALTGYGLQLSATSLLGAPLHAGLATGLALPPGVALGARIARLIGRIFPKTATTAISRRAYGRRRGVITVGTAAADKPAQARFRDQHGNLHYAMVVPFDPADTLPEGSEIAILRSHDGVLKAVRID